MADYKYVGPTVEDGVIRISDGASIPNSQGNRHWREYLEYVDGGGLTDDWKTPAELQDMADIEQRVADLEAEVAAANIHSKTPQEAKDWIDAQFDGASNNAEILAAIKVVLKKMAVYLLR